MIRQKVLFTIIIGLFLSFLTCFSAGGGDQDKSVASDIKPADKSRHSMSRIQRRALVFLLGLFSCGVFLSYKLLETYEWESEKKYRISACLLSALFAVAYLFVLSYEKRDSGVLFFLTAPTGLVVRIVIKASKGYFNLS